MSRRAPGSAGRLSEIVASAGQQAGVRLVIQAGQAGLTQAGPAQGDSILISDVPHDWLFPQLGAAPPPVPYTRLSAAALTAAIREATTRPSYRAQAQALAGRLASEDGTGPVIDAVSRLRR